MVVSCRELLHLWWNSAICSTRKRRTTKHRTFHVSVKLLPLSPLIVFQSITIIHKIVTIPCALAQGCAFQSMTAQSFHLKLVLFTFSVECFADTHCVGARFQAVRYDENVSSAKDGKATRDSFEKLSSWVEDRITGFFRSLRLVE